MRLLLASVKASIGRNEKLMAFAVTYGALTTLVCGLSFLAGILFSHRSAGVIYAFEKNMDDLIEGGSKNLKLRENSHFKNLESVADRLRARFSSKKD